MSGSYARVETKESASGWYGAGEEARMPVPVNAGAGYAQNSRDVSGKETRRDWRRLAKRALFDIAIVMAVIIAVPVVGLVKLADGNLWRTQYSLDRVRLTEPMRRYTIPVDASITPMDAGRSLAAVQDPRPSGIFQRQEMSHPAKPWQTMKIASDLFGGERSHSFAGPNELTILQSTARGLSSAELAVLREIALAPVWRDFDRVARAPAIDVIGGAFQLPFSPNARFPLMPVPQFAGSKELAYAAVSRAAYHMAIGQRDSAEAVLRSVVSFGFGVSDNGATIIEQLMGRVIVGIGNNALVQFYTVTHDSRVSDVNPPALESTQPGSWPESGSPTTLTVEQMRQKLLASAADPKALRGMRFESLELLSFSSCTNVRELLFGRRKDVRDAFIRARTELARYPSELALLDLMQREPTAKTVDSRGLVHNPLRDFLIGTSTIAGGVLGNPRLAACAMMIGNP